MSASNEGPQYSTHLKLVLIQIFWAGTFVASEIALLNQPPAFTAIVRFVLTSFGYILLCVYLRGSSESPLFLRLRKLGVREWFTLFMMGFFCVTIYTLFLHFGLTKSSAAYAALLIPTTQPLFTAILSSFLEKGSLNRSLIIGLVLGFFGAALILSESYATSSESTSHGNLLILLAAASFAIYAVSARRAPSALSSVEASAVSFVIGTCALLPAPFLLNEQIDLGILNSQFVFSIFYLVVFATFLPYLWWNSAVKELGSAKTGIYTFLMPPSAILLAYLVLGQSPTIMEVFGGVIALFGVAIANFGVKGIFASRLRQAFQKS